MLAAAPRPMWLEKIPMLSAVRARVCAVRSHVSNAVSYLGIRPCLSEFELQLEHLLFELYALEREGGQHVQLRSRYEGGR